MQKLVSQFDLDWSDKAGGQPQIHISEDRATLLFFIDTFSKHLIEIDSQPVRKVREALDGFSKELLTADDEEAEKVLFRLRQFFGTYRIEEYSYLQKTFDDFRGIIWSFVDQLAEDFGDEKKEDRNLRSGLENLKEAVEANSIDSLKTQARQFIHNYVEYQSRKDTRRSKRLDTIKKNLDSVKKQLTDVSQVVNIDHLTQAYNRKAFDEHVKNLRILTELSKKPATMIAIDIDYFKKVNDTFGHAVGDVVLQECVKMLRSQFGHENDFIARVGGEEFVVVMAETTLHDAVKRAEACLVKIRKDALVINEHTLRFTVSMGIAQMLPDETPSDWLKRADKALYESKANGRDRLTISGLHSVKEDVA